MASGNKATPEDFMYRPPTASTALWSQLLRTSTTTEAPKSLKDMPIIAPPMAPLDKNATSMRILLHDTQANFEKFTSHVGKLLESIQEMKNGLKTMHSCFQHDRENLMGDIVDLVNRSQKEIQKSVGMPAQADTVVALFKDVTHRLESLDQRLDAINVFNQTHAQTLQTQMQSIQLILDKQGSIISAVAPLLPLLQGLPPHIDSAKTAIKEEIGKLSIAHKNLSLAPCLSGPTQVSTTSPSSKTTKKRKRSLVSQEIAPSSSSSPTRPGLSPMQKRTRTLEPLEHLHSGVNVQKTIQNQAYIPTAAAASSPSTLPTPVPIPSSGNRLQSLLKGRRGTLTTERLTTPPPPLNGLTPARSSTRRTSTTVYVPDYSPSSGVFSHSSASTLPVPVVPSRSVTFTNTSGPIQQSNQASLPAFLGPATRTPRMLPVHALSNNSRANSVQTVSRGCGLGSSPRTGQNAIETEVNPIVNGLNPAMRTSTARSSADATPASSAGSKRTPIMIRIANSNIRAKTPLSQAFVPQQVVNDEAEGGEKGVPVFAPFAVTKLKGNNLQNSVASGKMTGRRSPLKEGRRFIPLMDSDDEENS